jgi:hypothetical protein
MSMPEPGRPRPPAPPSRNQDNGESQRFTDTLTGLNLRLKDNLGQIVGGAVGAVVGAVIVGVLWERGAVCIGGAAGLLAGVFAVGLFLGIYRLFRH